MLKCFFFIEDGFLYVDKLCVFMMSFYLFVDVVVGFIVF